MHVWWAHCQEFCRFIIANIIDNQFVDIAIILLLVNEGKEVHLLFITLFKFAKGKTEFDKVSVDLLKILGLVLIIQLLVHRVILLLLFLIQIFELILFNISELNGFKAVPSFKNDHIVVVSQDFLIAITVVDLDHFSLAFSDEDVASLDQGLILVVEIVEVFVWIIDCK